MVGWEGLRWGWKVSGPRALFHAADPAGRRAALENPQRGPYRQAKKQPRDERHKVPAAALLSCLCSFAGIGTDGLHVRVRELPAFGARGRALWRHSRPGQRLRGRVRPALRGSLSGVRTPLPRLLRAFPVSAPPLSPALLGSLAPSLLAIPIAVSASAALAAPEEAAGAAGGAAGLSARGCSLRSSPPPPLAPARPSVPSRGPGGRPKQVGRIAAAGKGEGGRGNFSWGRRRLVGSSPRPCWLCGGCKCWDQFGFEGEFGDSSFVAAQSSRGGCIY